MVRDRERPPEYQPVRYLDEERELRREVERLSRELFESELAHWSTRQSRELDAVKATSELTCAESRAESNLIRSKMFDALTIRLLWFWLGIAVVWNIILLAALIAAKR